MHHKEKRYRSLTKAIVYRLISVCVDYVIVYFITKDFEKSTLIVVFSNTISLIVYFVHERAWNRITWGRHTDETAERIISGSPLPQPTKEASKASGQK